MYIRQHGGSYSREVERCFLNVGEGSGDTIGENILAIRVRHIDESPMR